MKLKTPPNETEKVESSVLRSPSFRLDGKTAVVTGGASGIGRAIAECFAAAGASVRIVERDGSAAERAVKQITGAGGRASAFHCDVSDWDEVQRTFASICHAGPVDILVNNAGIAQIGKLENTSEKDFDAILRVNVKGVYHCMRACIESMKQNGGGVILNMASTAATTAVADRFAYSMSKGAVVSMTYSVAQDYVKNKIRCNCISPARVHTPFVDGYITKNYPGHEKEMFEKLSQAQPVGRMGEPHEVAALALFLCSDEASFITGADYPLDGGFFKLRA